MSPDLLHSLLSNAWSFFLIALFFGGSIFVHELGHYLAARRRGVHVERFSIGFGPPIFSWKGSDGTQYQVAWVPLGGYVLLPQLADLGALEGPSDTDAAKLPQVAYGTKMLVFVAGAAFNVLFAFVLACAIWIVGQPESDETTSTRVGYVSRTLELPDGSRVASPAAEGGLRVGDVVLAIDGHPVADWDELNQTLLTSSGRGPNGSPRTVFTVLRSGARLDLVLHPRLAGDEGNRRVGIMVGYDLNVHAVEPGSAAGLAGLRPGDRILEVDGAPVMNVDGWAEALAASPSVPAKVAAMRDGRRIEILVPARTGAHTLGGVEFSVGYHLSHPSPFAQIAQQVDRTLLTLWGLINPNSDVGLSKVSGPVGIVRIFHEAADAGIRYVLMFTILVNVNLAIFNLLPVPVLDGGQMLFATIARLRGRALPINFIVTAQSIFIVLLFSMVIYVSYFDVRRWRRDAREDRAQAAAAQAAAAPAAAPSRP
ncbi:MAG TPA: RIP metalloprotease RseP [Opitutaceae bacterium]|nr:RIP metalloprotease RseP [Opitutaceae bacterium]